MISFFAFKLSLESCHYISLFFTTFVTLHATQDLAQFMSACLSLQVLFDSARIEFNFMNLLFQRVSFLPGKDHRAWSESQRSTEIKVQMDIFREGLNLALTKYFLYESYEFFKAKQICNHNSQIRMLFLERLSVSYGMTFKSSWSICF